jgi:hypothetical protein
MLETRRRARERPLTPGVWMYTHYTRRRRIRTIAIAFCFRAHAPLCWRSRSEQRRGHGVVEATAKAIGKHVAGSDSLDGGPFKQSIRHPLHATGYHTRWTTCSSEGVRRGARGCPTSTVEANEGVGMAWLREQQKRSESILQAATRSMVGRVT